MGNVKQDSSENNLPKGHPPQITPQGIPDPRSKSEKNNKPKEKGSYKRGDYIAKVAPTSANDDEKLQIARICEGFRGFSSIATMILQVYLRSTYAQVAVQPKSKSETSKPKPPGGIVYTPDKIQTYAEWSENFVKLMCLCGHEKERSEFNKLSNYRRIRRWLSVLGAYLFAQVAVLSGYHEKVSNSQIKASSPLLKSYGNVKSNLMMMRKTFLQLKRASGLWPRYGQDRADQVQQVLDLFSTIKIVPYSPKRQQNKLCRCIQHWQLRTIVFFGGYVEEKEKTFPRGISPLLWRWICYCILGRRDNHQVQPVLRWVRIAEWASVENPRTVENLRTLYDDDKLGRLSDLISSHVSRLS